MNRVWLEHGAESRLLDSEHFRDGPKDEPRPEFVVGTNLEFLEGPLFVANLGGVHLPLHFRVQVRFEDLGQPVVVPRPIAEADSGNESVISPDFVPGDRVVKLGFELMISNRPAQMQDRDTGKEGLQRNASFRAAPTPKQRTPRDLGIDGSRDDVGGGLEGRDGVNLSLTS